MMAMTTSNSIRVKARFCLCMLFIRGVGLRHLDAVHAWPRGALSESEDPRHTSLVTRLLERVLQPGAAEELHAAVGQPDITLLGVLIIHPGGPKIGEVTLVPRATKLP